MLTQAELRSEIDSVQQQRENLAGEKNQLEFTLSQLQVCIHSISIYVLTLTALHQTDLDQARERAAQQTIKLSEISTAAEKEAELAKEAAAVSDGTLSQLKAFESYRDKMLDNIRKRREQFGAANYSAQVSEWNFEAMLRRNNSFFCDKLFVYCVVIIVRPLETPSSISPTAVDSAARVLS